MADQGLDFEALEAATPGLWDADPATGCIYGPDGKPIMTAGENAIHSDGRAWANAKLIAAAPTLLHLAKEASEMAAAVDAYFGPGAAARALLARHKAAVGGGR